MSTPDKNGHVLWTPAECGPTHKDQDWYQCPICDHGLGVCKVCGAAEVELDEPCKGSPSDIGGQSTSFRIKSLIEEGLHVSPMPKSLEGGEVEILLPFTATELFPNINALFGSMNRDKLMPKCRNCKHWEELTPERRPGDLRQGTCKKITSDKYVDIGLVEPTDAMIDAGFSPYEEPKLLTGPDFACVHFEYPNKSET